MVRDDRTPTFGNRQKGNQDKRMFVGSPDMIAHIANRKVNWVVFVLTGRNGDGRLVAPQDDGNEECSVSIRVFRDKVLRRRVSTHDCRRVNAIHTH